MARLFNDAVGDWLYVNQSVVASFPFAMACWFNDNDLTLTKNLMSICDKDVENQYHRLVAASSDKLWMNSQGGASGGTAVTSTTFLANTWYHACGIVAAANDRRTLLNAGGKGTQASAVTPTGLDRTTIGVIGKFTKIQYFSGMIAEAAIWDLSDWPGATDTLKADAFEKILPSLAKGFSPAHFPLGLVAYWPLIRGLNDKVGGYNLTVVGAAVSNHPRVILPHGVQ